MTAPRCEPREAADTIAALRVERDAALADVERLRSAAQYQADLVRSWGYENKPNESNGALIRRALEEGQSAIAETGRLREALNTPELHDFAAGVVSEAQHQRERWGAEHDTGKAPEDWFWLLGYLGGKALHAAKSDDIDKALHHTISTAAALANWHAALLGVTGMRPGIGPGSAGYSAARAALSAHRAAAGTGDGT